MYYLLETDYFQQPGAYRTRSLMDDWGLEPSDWIEGLRMEMPEAPMPIDLWERGGNGLAEMFLDSVPIFRKDLLETLRAAGVDNLQTCPARLQTPDGSVVENYLAVNIIGLVACADMDKSEYDDITGTGMIAVGFRKLIIDESAANGQLMFRLAQSVASIIVHERVKDAVQQGDFRYLSWRPLTE